MRAALLMLVGLLLGGCAALDSVSTDVASYSLWPAERRPGRYVFERLPSQQDARSPQPRLEAAARPALEAAGFTPADEPSSADVSVQLGAQAMPSVDRFGLVGPFDGYGFHGFHGFHGIHGVHGVPGHRFFGPGWPHESWGFGGGVGGRNAWERRYVHQVAVLIRDRRSGAVLYETRASSESFSPRLEATLPALFTAALSRFPAGSQGPVRVTVPVQPHAAAPASAPTPLSTPTPTPTPPPAPGRAGPP